MGFYLNKKTYFKMLILALRNELRHLRIPCRSMLRQTSTSSKLFASTSAPKPKNEAMDMAIDRNFTVWKDLRKNGISWLLNDQGQTSYRTAVGERPLTEVFWTGIMTVLWFTIFWFYFHDGLHFFLHPFTYHGAEEVCDEDLGLE